MSALDELLESQDLADREAEERDAWTRFAAGALEGINSLGMNATREAITHEAALQADLELDQWRARWGRKEADND